MLHHRVCRNFWKPFCNPIKIALFDCEQENESIIHVRVG